MSLNLSIQLFFLIYFQRLAISLGSAEISIPLIVTGIALLALAAGRRLVLSRTRLLLFAALGACAALSQAFCAGPVSLASISFLLAMYLTYTVHLEMDELEYLALCRSYSALMVLPAVLVGVQYAYQLVAGPGNSLAMDFLFPKALLLPGYVYESSTEFWRTWDRPNGIFFLEPSFCSAFLACAFLNEALLLRRAVFALLFFMALVLCSGATGFILVAIAVAWHLRFSQRAAALGVMVGLLVVALMMFGGRLAMLGRLAELGDPGSSGYDRLVLPLTSLFDLAGHPRTWLTGHGAGQITEGYGSAWPILKLAYEYGFPTVVAWTALFVAAIWGRPNVGFRVAIFVVFQFTGGYLLSPIMVLFTYLTCTVVAVRAPLMVVRPGAHARSGRVPFGASPITAGMPGLGWTSKPTRAAEP